MPEQAEGTMEQSKPRTVIALVLALAGGYLLNVSADPARELGDATLALVIGAALGLGTLVMLMRGYVSGYYVASAEELAYRPWRPIHFMTCAVRAAPLYVGIRLFLFLELYQAFSHKWADPAWHSGAALAGFWQRAVTPGPTGSTPATFVEYRAFLQWLLNIHAETWFTYVIMGAEIAIALGLLFGCLTGWAAFFGFLMNMSFLLAGTTSTNPLLVMLELLCLFGYSVAGYWGIDRWLLPAIGTPWSRHEPSPVVAGASEATG
jgi:thiosulfate dehydrogenase [quinone] large subunit